MEIIVDWNWFFSALAQSFAAIVGLIGAFLATKILNSETSFKKRQALAEASKRKTLNLEDYYRGEKKELQSLLEEGYGKEALIPHEMKYIETMKIFELQMDLNRSLLFEMKQNPEYSCLNSLIILLLLFLSIFGVIAPLYLMPITAQPNLSILLNNIFSIRSIFVLPPCLLFFIFLFFLHKTHENLKHEKHEKNEKYSNLIKSLEKYSDFSKYEEGQNKTDLPH